MLRLRTPSGTRTLRKPSLFSALLAASLRLAFPMDPSMISSSGSRQLSSQYWCRRGGGRRAHLCLQRLCSSSRSTFSRWCCASRLLSSSIRCWFSTCSRRSRLRISRARSALALSASICRRVLSASASATLRSSSALLAAASARRVSRSARRRRSRSRLISMPTLSRLLGRCCTGLWRWCWRIGNAGELESES